MPKTTHTTALLSLDKTKLLSDLMGFIGPHQVLLMHKLDGLTLKLLYENGVLIQASTRGNGDEGEVVTHNARAIEGIPMRIPYPGRLEVTGEAYITKPTFERLRMTLVDSTGKPYKNARNMAAGSVRCYDASACAERGVVFAAFGVTEGLDEDSKIWGSKYHRLIALQHLGFTTCRFVLADINASEQFISSTITDLQEFAESDGIPIDGIVVTYDDVQFSRSFGRTGSFYKDGIAFKFEDGLHKTTLREIVWQPSRTGELSPVALFDPVVIDGCEVSRASLHNITFIKDLELMPGCKILVTKRNMIIPHVEENLNRGRYHGPSIIPQACPCCGQATRIQTSQKNKGRLVEVLRCDNTACSTQNLRKFVHFVGKKAMDIDGLSEATLERFIEMGWLQSFTDIYRLDAHMHEIIKMDGFGDKSWKRLWDAIQNSRNTTFERFVIAMDIPMIGRTASKELCRHFNGDINAFKSAAVTGFDFTQLKDFGEVLHSNITSWFMAEENLNLWEELKSMVNIKSQQAPDAAPSTELAGKTFVVTGKLVNFTRAEIEAEIVSLGGSVGKAISKNTDYLITDKEAANVPDNKASSKLKKARELNVPILTEEDFLTMIGEA